jgi:polygalacturonase
MGLGSRRRSRRQFVSGLATAATAGIPAAITLTAASAEAQVRSATGAAGGAPSGDPAASAGKGNGATAAATAGRGGVFDITRFGAVGDGKTLNTQAIQRAIDACGKAGGGLVLVPPGRFVSGALFLRSNLQLHLSAGAILQASDNFEHFPAIKGRSEGIERDTYASLLTGQELENVAITGTGVLDGQGPSWWRAFGVTKDMRTERKLPREADNPPGSPLKYPRPRVVNLLRCQSVQLQGIHVRESPFWSVHLVYCQDVLVDGLTVTGLQAQHIDGIIIDSCKNVRISNCSVSAGSDPIALKSGYNQDGRRVAIPCEDIVITNCNLSFSVGAGISIGSETAGGVKNVIVSNCTISRSRYGIHIRAPRGRGGVVERIRMTNLVMDEIGDVALLISHFYDSVQMDSLLGDPKSTGNPETDRVMRVAANDGTPTFRELEFDGLDLAAVPTVAVIEGLPERFIRGLTIRNVVAPDAHAGIVCARAAELRIRDFRMNPVKGPMVAAREVEGLDIRGLHCARVAAQVPVVRLENVSGAFIHGCNVAAKPSQFVQQQGTRNRGVNLTGNNVAEG